MADKEVVEHYPDGTIIQRYPKWITLPDGRTKVIVQTKKEHDAAMGIKPVEASKKELEPPKIKSWGEK